MKLSMTRGIVAAALLAVSVLAGKPAAAHADKIPVWVRGSFVEANTQTATLVPVGQPGAPKETLGLWPFPITGFEALPFEFSPIEARPQGWAAVAWLDPGSYRVSVTWWDASGVAHPSETYTLSVP
jgi:hypothetical protein